MALNEEALLSEATSPTSGDLQTAEDIKFKSKTPFMTILSLTPGPLVHQVLSTGKSLIELMFIGHTCGNEGLTVYNSAFQFSNTLAHINGSPAGGTVVAVSSLIGKHQYSEAAQVVVDSFRITIPLSFLISIISYFIIIPFFNR